MKEHTIIKITCVLICYVMFMLLWLLTNMLCVLTLFVHAYHWSSYEAKPTQDLNGPPQAAGSQDKQPAPTSLTTTKAQI